MDRSTAEVSRIKNELGPVEVKIVKVKQGVWFFVTSTKHPSTQDRLRELDLMYEAVKDMEKRIGELPVHVLDI